MVVIRVEAWGLKNRQPLRATYELVDYRDLATGLFAMSYLPMLVKAHRTRDLSSYSLGNILLANTGNAVHSVYVFSLPAGPIWILHGFYLLTTGTMLCWFLRYGGMGGPTHAAPAQLRNSPDAAPEPLSLAS